MSKQLSRFALHIININNINGPYALMLVDTLGDEPTDIVSEGLIAMSEIVIEADCEDFNWAIDRRSVPLDLFDEWFINVPYLGSNWVAIKTKFREAAARYLLEQI